MQLTGRYLRGIDFRHQRAATRWRRPLASSWSDPLFALVPAVAGCCSTLDLHLTSWTATI